MRADDPNLKRIDPPTLKWHEKLYVLPIVAATAGDPRWQRRQVESVRAMESLKPYFAPTTTALPAANCAAIKFKKQVTS